MKTLVSLALAVFVIASLAVQAQAPAGGEFRVSSATAVGDTTPSVAVDARGAFVVAWVDASVASPLKARRYDPLGVPGGGQFTVTPNPAGLSASSSASDDKGRTMLVWRRNGGNVAARSFDASGAPIGSEFTVNNTPGYGLEPAVAASRAGTFVVVWESGFDGSGAGIMGRRVGLWGNAVGPQFIVNSFTTGNQYEPTVATDQLGRFVVVWTGAGDGSSTGVFGRRFDNVGQPIGADFLVNAYTTGRQFDPQVVTDHLGAFVVVWQDSQLSAAPRIVGRRFDASGAPQGAEFAVGSFSVATVYDISAASDRAGNFTVAWENPDGSDRGVFARRFTAAGVPRGAQFRVNTATTSLQRYPDVAADPSGNLFAAWSSHQSGTTMEIYGQRFGGLVPEGLFFTDATNGVLEVNDGFTLITFWRNVSGTTQTFQGRSAVTAPAGLALALSPDADYGTVANGAIGSCGSICFTGTLAGARPTGHVDAIVMESILPEVQGQVKRWALHVGDSFLDVPRASPFYRFVETLFHHDITSGCTANQFCPASVTTREQMAPFLLVAREGAGYSPPGCVSSIFADVPHTSIYCPFIEELWRRGVVGGCGGNNYCPTAAVTREQMAVFVLRTLDPALNPPACGTPVFNDVPASSPFCRWIEELARRGIASGCGGGNYCPSAAVTREQMSVFLSVTFGLTLYGP